MEAVLKQCQREMSELKVKQAVFDRCRQGVAQLETQYPFLAGHAKFLATRASVRVKWPDEPHVRTIYLLLAQNMSEASWNEMGGHLGLPPWRTIQDWRHKEWSKRGLTKDVLNGTTESLFRVLKVLRDTCRSKLHFNENATIMIDAMAVQPSFRFDLATGQCHG
jgi:hypothetical protein